MSAPPLADVVAALDDETLLRTMREQLVRSFPLFEGAPPRVRAIRDRLMREVEALPDLLDAAERALNYIANTESELGITLDSGDTLRAALKKARGE